MVTRNRPAPVQNFSFFEKHLLQILPFQASHSALCCNNYLLPLTWVVLTSCEIGVSGEVRLWYDLANEVPLLFFFHCCRHRGVSCPSGQSSVIAPVFSFTICTGCTFYTVGGGAGGGQTWSLYLCILLERRKYFGFLIKYFNQTSNDRRHLICLRSVAGRLRCDVCVEVPDGANPMNLDLLHAWLGFFCWRHFRLFFCPS